MTAFPTDGSHQRERPEFYSPQQFAEVLGASRGFVYVLMDKGLLKNFKLGRKRMIPASEIERLKMTGDENL
jgi:excisionase family DNA binding protein